MATKKSKSYNSAKGNNFPGKTAGGHVIILPVITRRAAPKQSAHQRPGNRPVNQNTGNMYNRLTPQGKMQQVAQKLGIPGIQGQQGTTRTIYHGLPLDQGLNDVKVYKFFQNVKAVGFPFTNIQENKLEAGEVIAVQRHYYAVVSFVAGTEEIASIQTLDNFAVPAMYGGTYNLRIGQQDYTKDTSLMAFKPEFNQHATHINYNVYHTGVDVVIPPDLQFTMPTTMPAMTIPSSDTLDFFLFAFIEGDGSILNMKNNL